MILRQILHFQPAIASSYLVGCTGQGVAAVIDPIDEASKYLELAASFGTRLKYVIDTHVHADHLSSGRALAEAAGAAYVLHESAAAAFTFELAREGDELELGNVRLSVLHLPGHTPEHLGLVAIDRTRSERPWLAFTGHTLMVGDMGRTELASSAEDGARALFDSGRKLAALPDDVLVLPGAFAGSVCGRGLSGTPMSTLGFERLTNRAFRIEIADEFVRYMQAEVPARPPNAEATRARNMGLEPVIGAAQE